jgi:hypothetical protein
MKENLQRLKRSPGKKFEKNIRISYSFNQPAFSRRIIQHGR